MPSSSRYCGEGDGAPQLEMETLPKVPVPRLSLPLLKAARESCGNGTGAPPCHCNEPRHKHHSVQAALAAAGPASYS